ncbi:hypothetical protein JNUCC0626_47975 [Lentzea sp. JNUCC 0626]|uniref:hypothetical protein n=1 Tax=Lentzea sp. JNUCC 0626 TaxID=3367513 RepID=UPI0037486073
MATKFRKPGRLATAALLAIGAVVALAQPSSAATPYNVMIIGKDIPAGVGSVALQIDGNFDFVCVKNLQTGVDKNTHFSISPGQRLFFDVAHDSVCGKREWDPSHVVAPWDNGGLKNWWLSLRGTV